MGLYRCWPIILLVFRSIIFYFRVVSSERYHAERVFPEEKKGFFFMFFDIVKCQLKTKTIIRMKNIHLHRPRFESTFETR